MKHVEGMLLRNRDGELHIARVESENLYTYYERLGWLPGQMVAIMRLEDLNELKKRGDGATGLSPSYDGPTATAGAVTTAE